MALVRRLVELHGGTISVGDAPEHGAVFKIALPGTPAEEASLSCVAPI